MPDPNTPPTSPVWPPAPGGMPTDKIEDIREFEHQDDWRLFLLLIVTLGIYLPFWMIRTSKTINRIAPNKPVSLHYPQILLGLLIINLLLLGTTIVLFSTHPTIGAILYLIWNLWRWVITIYVIVVSFMYRDALNRILDRTTPPLRDFGAVGTFLFGPLYLQIRLNQRIKEREIQLQQEGFWPPAPASNEKEFSPAGTGNIREFQYQNGWLLFLLSIVTLGIYWPLWMMRTSKVYNRIYPSMPIPGYHAAILLALRIARIPFGFFFLMMLGLDSDEASYTIGITMLVSLSISIYALVLNFIYRNALNRAIEQTSPKLKLIGGIGTFFLGVLWLQICLNKRIKERQAQVQEEAMS